MALTKTRKPKATGPSVFIWEGLDRGGTRVKGQIQAATLALVRAELRRQGVSLLKIRKKPPPWFGGIGNKIRSADIAVFSRQLATMMSAGVPLVQAFDIIGHGHDNPRMRDLVLAVKADIESGTSLTEALRKHPLHFDELVCNLVAAGEQAGVLDLLLDKIATYKEKTESLKGKIKKALVYPIAVILVAILVTAAIMLFVIPQFEALFTSFGADLPAFTRLVIAISDLMHQWWWGLLLAPAVLYFSIKTFWRRWSGFREILHRLGLKLPLVGPVMHQAAVARFARTLSTTFAAGVPLVEALESVAGATGNLVYSRAVMQMREEVATGQALQRSMHRRNLFPHLVVQMTAVGEESGVLEDMLAKVADFYEEAVDNAVDGLSSLLEPMIMIVIGTLVGGLVIAMYLPVFKLAAVV
ncbi:type II secretion system F family protein [Candidatus Thiosymbion oneisti]|uniref:type II secretion system F family protein n=1 Tax=Candidatus Thiosymbion oneisti TaxID=589554 RepID=UPI000B0B222B|nr:type II secretion system F family protein [Candidatus Thiosymbion oneisti]